MRFEYHCVCNVIIATEEIDSDVCDIQILQNLHEVQMSTHIANCRQALRNYSMREVTNEEDKH